MPLHYTKSGSLDMRYSSSRAAVASGGGGSSSGSGNSGGGGGGSYSGGGSSGASGGGSYSGGGSGYSYGSTMSGSSGDLHFKKDGTLDMRYNSSKSMTSPGAVGASSSSSYGSSTIGGSDPHYKKDGTLDMRYTSSKGFQGSPSSASNNSSSSDLHYKKDGSLDLRYTSSQAALAGQFGGLSLQPSGRSGIPAHIPLTKNGRPDMRTTIAKEWVANAAKSFNEVPGWVPKKKDGSIDGKSIISRAFLEGCPQGARANVDHGSGRRDYYDTKYSNDVVFRECVDRERMDLIEKQITILLEQNELQKIIKELQELLKNANRGGKEDSKLDLNSLVKDVKKIEYGLISGQIQEENILGRGNFGIVYKAKIGGEAVAIKKLHLSKLTRPELTSFVKELTILNLLGQHPNLVCLKGFVEFPPCIVMEFVPGGTLSHLLHFNEDPKVEAKLTDGRVKRVIVGGIANGMLQLHLAGIIHGDLKPQNILLTKNFTAKVTDFGLATLRGKTGSTIASVQFDDGESVVGGTGGYMAPELLNSSSKYGPEFPSDVYSFGVLLNEVVCEEEPYTGKYHQFAGRGPFAAVNFASIGNRPRIDIENTPKSLVKLIQDCWDPQPRKRPTFREIADKITQDDFSIPDSFTRN